MRIKRLAIAALSLSIIFGCSSATLIDDAITTVQSATRAYKRHCGVGVGQKGPGTCDAVEYQTVQDAYVSFQKTVDAAIDLAEKQGVTTSDIILKARDVAISIINQWQKGK